MRQWMLMYRKENLEMWRNYKWVWVPIVFVILGLTQPLSSYFMPQILDAVGGMPEGTIIEFPTPTGEFVMLETINNFGMIGLLILVLVSMSIVSGELNSGVAGMILVKPVKFMHYITAKWAALMTLTVVSLGLGMLTAWYYTGVLIGSVDGGDTFASFAIYSLWLGLVMTLAVVFSTMFRSAGTTAFLVLIVTILLSIATSTLRSWMEWSPANLTANAASILTEQTLTDYFWVNVGITVVLIAALLWMASALFKRKELVA